MIPEWWKRIGAGAISEFIKTFGDAFGIYVVGRLVRDHEIPIGDAWVPQRQNVPIRQAMSQPADEIIAHQLAVFQLSIDGFVPTVSAGGTILSARNISYSRTPNDGVDAAGPSFRSVRMMAKETVAQKLR